MFALLVHTYMLAYAYMFSLNSFREKAQKWGQRKAVHCAWRIPSIAVWKQIGHKARRRASYAYMGIMGMLFLIYSDSYFLTYVGILKWKPQDFSCIKQVWLSSELYPTACFWETWNPSQWLSSLHGGSLEPQAHRFWSQEVEKDTEHSQYLFRLQQIIFWQAADLMFCQFFKAR